MLRGRNSAASADEQPHIGNYRLLKTIGKGNFAKVKLARHVLTGKEVSGPAAIRGSWGSYWEPHCQTGLLGFVLGAPLPYGAAGPHIGNPTAIRGSWGSY